jgi:tetratricopeptide (TPR) repeat protein
MKQTAFLPKLILLISLVICVSPASRAEAADNPSRLPVSRAPESTKNAPLQISGDLDPDYRLAIPLIKSGRYREALPFLENALRKPFPHPYVKADYLLCLIWTDSHPQAVGYYLGNERELAKVAYATRHAARAFYETSDFLMAQSLYEKAWRENPVDLEALKGVVYSLVRQGNFTPAHEILDENAARLQPLLYGSSKAWVCHAEGRHREAYGWYARLSLMAEEECFLREIQDRRKDLAPALSETDAQLLGRDPQNGDLFVKIFLLDTRQHARAFSVWPYEYRIFPFGFLLELGWGLYQAGKTADSLRVYEFLQEKWPNSCLARIGAAYPLAGQGRFAESHRLVDRALQQKCFLFDALFAKAFLFEQEKKRAAALSVYDEILKLRPGNAAALKMKIRNLSEIGATSLAAAEIERNKVQDLNLRQLVEGNSAVDRLRWEQPQEALLILEKQVAEDPANLRARFDSLVSLRKMEKMKEVAEHCERLKFDGVSIPSWVSQVCGDAYLYLQKPEEALILYKESLTEPPNLSGLTGLFYVYQELRDWDNAERTLREIDELLQKQNPERWPKVARVPREGWFLDHDEKMRTLLDYYEGAFNHLGTRGWHLISRDRLAEAENHFSSYVENAGMASAFRMGLAHAHLWQGKPRLALEDFKIIENADPEYLAALNGLAVTLNRLNYKKESRELAGRLFERFPADTHVRNTHESFQVEDMYRIETGGRFVVEDSGAEEYGLWARLTEPVTPTFALFQEIVWQEARDDANKAYWNRAGVGAEWIVFPELVWRQAVTADYAHGRDWGYYTSVRWWPSDPLRFTLSYDSFSLDLPLRARAQGIEGQAASLNGHYHESDLRHYGLLAGTDWFSDSNQYFFGKANFEQNVFNRPDFKIRLGGELYYGSYRNQDVDYFSPADEYSLVAKAGFYWTHYLRYDRKFLSALYPRLGLYKQSGYGFYPVGGLTYEQTIETSKTFSLVWNISWDQRVYDGDPTSVWSGFFHVRKNF